MHDSTDDEDDEFSINLGNDSQNISKQFTKLDAMLADDDFNVTVDAQIVVTKAEIILAIMKLCSRYNIPNSELADIFKMLNSFLNKSIFSDNRYQVNEMFYP